MNKTLIKQHTAFSEREAAAVMRTIVSVIAHCHEHGVMHRDVKLENFVFTDESDKALLKAVDFGLSGTIQVSRSSPNPKQQ
jgi:serine/threonine protein kinase